MLSSREESINNLITSLEREIHDLNNAVDKAKKQRTFLRQQVFNQFATIDITTCRRVLGDVGDILGLLNADQIVETLLHYGAITEKFTSNSLTLQPSVIELSNENEIGKRWYIEGQVNEIKYLLQFSTKFELLENGTKEYVDNINRLEFVPSFPYLVEMSEHLKKGQRIETLISSLYILQFLKQRRNKLLNELDDYEEITVEEYGDDIVFNVSDPPLDFKIKCSIIYNESCSNFFHKLEIIADSDTLVRYSQHRNIDILKGEKKLDIDDVVEFIGSLFSDVSESSEEDGEE